MTSAAEPDDTDMPWDAPPEDVAEQLQPAVPDADPADDNEPDEDEMPLEAEPADVLEQRAVAPSNEGPTL
jgi:hypothetical protein